MTPLPAELIVSFKVGYIFLAIMGGGVVLAAVAAWLYSRMF